jgi:hypothetical protein
VRVRVKAEINEDEDTVEALSISETGLRHVGSQVGGQIWAGGWTTRERKQRKMGEEEERDLSLIPKCARGSGANVICG